MQTRSLERQPIRLFVTGGTFDKEYNELNGQLYFEDTHVLEMLRMGRCLLDVEVRTLMMIDSLEMTGDDRQIIAGHCESASETRMVITHGTDTMSDTAAVLGRQGRRQQAHLGERHPGLRGEPLIGSEQSFALGRAIGGAQETSESVLKNRLFLFQSFPPAPGRRAAGLRPPLTNMASASVLLCRRSSPRGSRR